MRLNSRLLLPGDLEREFLRKPVAIHTKPAAHPVNTATCIDGCGPRKIANMSAEISDSRNPSPKMSEGLCARKCSGKRGWVCHPSPKSSGAYQMPPTTNAAIAATSTANKLIPAITLLLICGPACAGAACAHATLWPAQPWTPKPAHEPCHAR